MRSIYTKTAVVATVVLSVLSAGLGQDDPIIPPVGDPEPTTLRARQAMRSATQDSDVEFIGVEDVYVLIPPNPSEAEATAVTELRRIFKNHPDLRLEIQEIPITEEPSRGLMLVAMSPYPHNRVTVRLTPENVEKVRHGLALPDPTPDDSRSWITNLGLVIAGVVFLAVLVTLAMLARRGPNSEQE
ncbi:MAG: hypothetical protein ACLFVU_05130 [Phycisphaerae bacterium]